MCERTSLDDISCWEGNARMMMRLGAEDLDSRKAHGPPPRQQDLTGQQPPTIERTKPTSPNHNNSNMPQNSHRNDRPHHNNKNSNYRILSHLSSCRQNNPYQHSSRIVEFLRLKLKESAARRQRAKSPNQAFCLNQKMSRSQTLMTWPLQCWLIRWSTVMAARRMCWRSSSYRMRIRSEVVGVIERKMTRTRNSFRRAKKAAVNKEVADKDRVMRTRWVLTWKSTGKAKESRCGDSRSRPHRSSSRQPHTFCTGWGLDLTLRGVKQVEAGVRRHQDRILVSWWGAPEHLHSTSQWCSRPSEAQPKVNAETSQSCVWSRERPEEMVGSVETITPESWLHILCQFWFATPGTCGSVQETGFSMDIKWRIAAAEVEARAGQGVHQSQGHRMGPSHFIVVEGSHLWGVTQSNSDQMCNRSIKSQETKNRKIQKTKSQKQIEIRKKKQEASMGYSILPPPETAQKIDFYKKCYKNIVHQLRHTKIRFWAPE